jgi:hypothetical protein
MVNRILTAMGVFLLPLVPVLLLYWLFKELNFFELTGGPQWVLKAGGPVAAYCWLLWFAVKNVGKLWSNDANEAFIGKWVFESKSPTGKIGTGVCLVEEKNGDLTISGTFSEVGKNRTNWSAEFAIAGSSRLIYLTSLPTNTGGTFLNVVTLSVEKFEKNIARKLTGSWIAWNDEIKRGEMIMERETV